MPRIRPPKQQAETKPEAKPNHNLDEIAVQVRASLKKNTKNNTHVGKLLQQAADQCEYGQYKEWLAGEFDMSEDTAMNYRNLHRLSENPNGSGFLTMDINDRALYRLGALLKHDDRDDIEEVFKQVKEAAKEGRVTLDVVTKIIDQPRCEVCGRTKREVLAAGHTLEEKITCNGKGAACGVWYCTECKARVEAEPSPDEADHPVIEPEATLSPEDDDEDDPKEERWQNSLGNFAGEAIAMRAFWKKEFGDWEKFDCPSDLVTLAKQAAQAWTELAANLSKSKETDAVKAKADKAEAKAAGKMH